MQPPAPVDDDEATALELDALEVPPVPEEDDDEEEANVDDEEADVEDTADDEEANVDEDDTEEEDNDEDELTANVPAVLPVPMPPAPPSPSSISVGLLPVAQPHAMRPIPSPIEPTTPNRHKTASRFNRRAEALRRTLEFSRDTILFCSFTSHTFT